MLLECVNFVEPDPIIRITLTFVIALVFIECHYAVKHRNMYHSVALLTATDINERITDRKARGYIYREEGP